MKMTGLVVMASMAGASLFAGQSTAAKEATVTVCIDFDPSIPPGTLALASQMFARVGVRIDWRTHQTCPAGAGAIQVGLSFNSPDNQFRHALGFAQPYEGVHIVVFSDRVQRRQKLIYHHGPHVMAHVLVHEITHMLEGISRHSVTGIMKDHWDADDYFAMCGKPLAFAPEDITLIHRGLKARQTGLAISPTRVTPANSQGVAVQ